MRPQGARLLRRGLIGLVVAVSVAVAFNLRKRTEVPGAERGPSEGGSNSAAVTRFGDLVFRKYRDGKLVLLLEAEAMVAKGSSGMHLRSVQATLPRTREGKEEAVTIRADECLYEPDRERADFSGNVRITTSEGVELETTTLTYDGAIPSASTEAVVRFRRGNATGSARGVRYDGRAALLSLSAEVELRIEEAGREAAVVTAARGELLQREADMRLDGGVVVTQGRDRLSASQVKLTFTSDLGALRRMVAVEDVVVDAVGTTSLASMSGGVVGAGSRRLTARRLDIWFTEAGELHEVTAVRDAVLAGTAGGGRESVVRRIAARVLVFRFEGGRLSEVEGLGQSDVSVQSARGGSAQRVTAVGMRLGVDPVTGALVRSRFEGDVRLVEPGRQGSADVVTQDHAKGLVQLTGNAHLTETARGSDLRANEISVRTKDGALTARGGVQHEVPAISKPAAAGSTSGPFSAGEAVSATAGSLEYDPAARRGTYRDGASLRSGESSVEGDVVTVDESEAGRRSLSAMGSVVCHMLSRRSREQNGPTAPVDVTSAEMTYDEAARRIVFRGNVHMRRADVTTVSPTATVLLAAEGDRLESVVAGEPVEVTQGGRRATGQEATYRASDDTMVIVGESVVLSEPSRTVRGKRVLFFLGKDQVRVEGLDETRTETVIRRSRGKQGK